MPSAMPPCGGAPSLQRVEQEAELLARLVVADAERLEHARLHLGIVQTDRAAADLEAVEHEVVAVAEHLARVLLEQVDVLVVRARERVVRGGPALGVCRRTRTAAGR